MKTLKRNQRKFYYCLYSSESTVYDEYGNETGEPKVIYAAPVEMYANISQATGQTNIEQFGNLENYDKVIVTDDMECPIDEHSVLFIDKEPEFNEVTVGQTTTYEPVYDYTVKRVAKSLNSISIAIRKVDVS